MSTIKSITAIPLSFPLPEGKTVVVGIGQTIKRDAVIVRVESDNDICMTMSIQNTSVSCNIVLLRIDIYEFLSFFLVSCIWSGTKHWIFWTLADCE